MALSAKALSALISKSECETATLNITLQRHQRETKHIEKSIERLEMSLADAYTVQVNTKSSHLRKAAREHLNQSKRLVNEVEARHSSHIQKGVLISRAIAREDGKKKALLKIYDKLKQEQEWRRTYFLSLTS